MKINRKLLLDIILSKEGSTKGYSGWSYNELLHYVMSRYNSTYVLQRNNLEGLIFKFNENVKD